MNRILPALLLILLFEIQAFSQHGSAAYRKHGDTQYQHHHYQSAVEFYTKALTSNSPETGYLMLQLARCYVRTNQPAEAEKWFIQASANQATLTTDDYYLYARTLVTLNKRNQADELLEHLLKSDPNSAQARKALADLRDFEKYYQDSAKVQVDSVSINSSVAEFGPAYYKEGLVFSSARMEGILRKKYHWDNSNFLNLYYSPKATGAQLSTPQLFEQDLNTRHHEGPAMFYDQYRKMILNRNQTVTVEGKEDVYERRLALYDATADVGKSTWTVTPLPFNDPGYSLAHPCISEDGNVLYFISDIPGGYGGTDIYRVVRTNGIWGKPFNLGPVVNSPENETFPFYIHNKLYFASRGHGGLGGLDMFQCTQTVNGFSPPENLGYPMNSAADDFSLITRLDQRDGYFASSRGGEDDMFYFQKPTPEVSIVAHVYDSLTQTPISDVQVQLITGNGTDSTLHTNSEGNSTFMIPEGTSYVILATQADKIGMASDIADESKTHQITTSLDTVKVACIGFIQNQDGKPKNASIISILDETTGQKIEYPGDTSQITFLGEKGHQYQIDIQGKDNTKASHKLVIGLNDKDPKIWTMVLPDAQPLDMAVRVYRGDDNQPLANASVKVITFGETEQELTTDADGLVNFTLKEGTAFEIIGSKDNLKGSTSGLAERGKTDKASMIIPLPLYEDTLKNVLAVGLVTNTKGEPIEGYRATVSNKKTGENIPAETKGGLLTFKGKPGESYNISVGHDDYLTTLQDLTLPEIGPEIHKFTVILEKNPDAGMKKAIPVVPVASVAAIKIADDIKTGKSELLSIDTDKGTSKIYIRTGETFSEITERDSVLYRETPRGNEVLGKGMLADLRRNPSSVLKGLEKSDLTKLRNIYFDFDKADLDPDDQRYLQQVKKILELDLTSRLIVAGHADDRGTNDYNIKLSQRRVQSVSNYLIAAGIPKDRIVLKAYGETLPVVPCHGADCSEDEHQKNRRAEFVLSQITL